ncbi:hypothetical protein FE257_009943 [Aspergillus nanangensis]|uniref:Histone deacetylase complex subunit SAP30 Sin3 binding domain-containing protein n=1 Tax=Aspergillus nanangensis TaxID=2582783 RepID=A0AAD4GZK8_ASPNN|nr:hypothetical protein FE257_009943 [Aspergillus nanangensis]
MAPPRQRTAAVQDDSRSEGSSTAKEVKSTAAKGRKAAAAGSTAVNSVSKVSSNLPNVTSAPAGNGEPVDNQPKINWPDMPLDILHSYRHSYKLSTPSAFASEYSHMLLSRGIGLLSPTAIAAQRAHLSRQSQESNDSNNVNGASSSHSVAASTNKSLPPLTTNGVGKHHHHNHNNNNKNKNNNSKRPAASSSIDRRSALNHIIGQDRVGKPQLALAVRKHFNSAGLAEQEAIARFLYKVREEGRGRHFRLRFQP